MQKESYKYRFNDGLTVQDILDNLDSYLIYERKSVSSIVSSMSKETIKTLLLEQKGHIIIIQNHLVGLLDDWKNRGMANPLPDAYHITTCEYYGILQNSFNVLIAIDEIFNRQVMQAKLINWWRTHKGSIKQIQDGE